MAEHLRGQDSLVTVTVDGEVLAQFSIQSCEVTPQQEIDSTRYLGADADNYEETFSGFTGDVSGHASGDGARGISAMFDAAIDRARRRRAGLVINLATTHAFSGGDRTRYIYRDIKIGSPNTSKSGNDRVEYSFSFATSDRAKF